jgi:hypothetical protein
MRRLGAKKRAGFLDVNIADKKIRTDLRWVYGRIALCFSVNILKSTLILHGRMTFSNMWFFMAGNFI